MRLEEGKEGQGGEFGDDLLEFLRERFRWGYLEEFDMWCFDWWIFTGNSDGKWSESITSTGRVKGVTRWVRIRACVSCAAGYSVNDMYVFHISEAVLLEVMYMEHMKRRNRARRPTTNAGNAFLHLP